MIINTGMRTDIPAFCHEWLINRIEEDFTCAYNIVYNIFVVTIWINRCRMGGNHENAR